MIKVPGSWVRTWRRQWDWNEFGVGIWVHLYMKSHLACGIHIGPLMLWTSEDWEFPEDLY